MTSNTYQCISFFKMASTELMLNGVPNLSLANLKSDFASSYRSSYADCKPKAKAKLSDFRSPPKSKLPALGSRSNVSFVSTNVGQQSDISNPCVQESKINQIPSNKSDSKCILKACTQKFKPSSSYGFFSECEKLEKQKYSGSDPARTIKTKIQNGWPWDVSDNQLCKKFVGERQPYWKRKNFVEKSHESLDLTKDFDLSGLSLND